MTTSNGEKSLLRVAFTSNATAQQPTAKRATGDATATQQEAAKPASLLDIARNKLRNKHATTSIIERSDRELVAQPIYWQLQHATGSLDYLVGLENYLSRWTPRRPKRRPMFRELHRASANACRGAGRLSRRKDRTNRGD